MKKSIECLPKNLSKNGFDGSKSPKDQIIVWQLEYIIDYIDCLFTKTKSLNMKLSSYRLKHEVEIGLQRYVSNGELIAAMIICGYHYKIKDINCVFNVKIRRSKFFKKSHPFLDTPPF